MTDTWTVRSLIDATRKLFADRGIESPRLDAEVLLAHVLDMRRMDLYLDLDRPIKDEQREEFRELVRRRATREPVAYLVGSRGFWSLDLKVNEHVLVPRPETERCVELTLAELSGYRGVEDWRIVDVGTGSGAIALALATELKDATVLGIDISSQALEVARENAETAGLRERVRFVRGDLLGPVLPKGAVLDVVVSNPPYIAERERADLDRDVADFEPELALFSGSDGLDAIRRLMPQALSVLRPGGICVVEIGAAQGDAVRRIALAHFDEARIEKDYAGLDRVLVARRSGNLRPGLSPHPQEGGPPTEPDGIADPSGDAEEESSHSSTPAGVVEPDDVSVETRDLMAAIRRGEVRPESLTAEQIAEVEAALSAVPVINLNEE